MGLDAAAVVELAGPLVRVHLPWELVESLSFDLHALTTRAELGALYLPWYRRSAAELWHGDVFAPDPSDPPLPLQVKDTPTFLPLYPDKRREAIERLAVAFRRHHYPQAFYAVGVRLGTGEVVVADGSHRLSALWLAEVEFRIALLTCCPPALAGFTDAERLEDMLLAGSAR
jgi:hypothetical protein